MTRRNLQRLIHVGAKQLGLDSATRHDLQLRIVGKASMADMTENELRAVATEMKRMGFRADAQGRRPAAKRADVRFCHVMWRLLVEAGSAKVAGPKGLNAFIRARFEKTWGHVPIDIDAMTEWSEIDDVVQALKDWCARDGIELN
jgi:hypothetical protein